MQPEDLKDLPKFDTATATQLVGEVANLSATMAKAMSESAERFARTVVLLRDHMSEDEQRVVGDALQSLENCRVAFARVWHTLTPKESK
jgi:hypothetical protein